MSTAPVRPLFAEAARALEAEGLRTRTLGASLAEPDGDRLVWDDWTVKDVLGHVSASHGALLFRVRGSVPPDAVGSTLAHVNEARRQARRVWPLSRVLEELEEARSALLWQMRELGNADWDLAVQMSAGPTPLGRVAWITSSHEREHRQAIEVALGRQATAGGRVAWLNVSSGGVPKLPIYQAELGPLGLEGDAHRHPRHGGPTAALCLFSLEVIERLRHEGHPIVPGAVGENVTVAGLDWSQLAPGDRLRIGPTLVEITRYTTPCANIAGAFRDGDFARILATTHPGDARAYAAVVEAGVIAVGDPVERIPGDAVKPR